MYGDLAAFRAYQAVRGNHAPAAASDVDATAALVRASDYIETNYVLRVAAQHKDPLPDAVVTAAFIAAGIELGSPGFFSSTYTPDQRKALVAVDGIKWQIVGDASGGDGATPVSNQIEALLKPYLRPDRGGLFAATVGAMVV